MTLKPWREVILPHEDVLEGKFDESEFAADLTKVVRGIAKPEYQEPERFFERTVITEGMGLLLQSVAKRLAGQGGDPVVQLQTAFGGGKTHTMMAVMHVAAGDVPATKMQGIPAILDKAGIKELAKARVAVLDGNELAPSQPQEHGKVVAHTLWGELAWQIGREDGYAMVADSDKNGTSPGKDILAKLLERFGPVVILLDEAVAYLRQLEPGKSYKGGTYNSNLSFLQALTEATARVPTAMLLASLPESMMEVGDHQGQSTLDACQKIFGRIEAVWKPVGTEEAFEIVRRRLFKQVNDEPARDEVCRAFADLYLEHSDKFPAETKEGAYLQRIKGSYPIHPEVFERLYEDWSTLQKFQRTRGVLRLMARLVHSLWRDDNRDYLVLPGSIPLADNNVRNELVKYLPQGWDAIVDKDIDGPHAEPRRIDDEVSTLGSVQACRRAARTVFLGSAPSTSGEKVRGIGVERVRLGCAQPDQSPARYDDALRRLGDRLHYLYSGNDRFWFDLRANLRREMETRMQRYDFKLHVYPEIQSRLQKLVKTNVFQGVHVFSDAKDIPDTVDLRLVVLDPDCCHKRKDEHSKAVQAAAEILTKHGEKPREYQNRVLFLAPDVNAVGPLRDHVRRFLAWQSIVDDADQLNLDKHHEKEAKKSLDDARARAEASLRESYRFMLAPLQEAGSTEIEWEDEALGLSGSTYEKAITTATRDKEWVIPSWGPMHLAALLKQWFWKDDQPAIGAKKVWLDTCRYLYMPRLTTEDVYVQTVRDGAGHKDWFGYAAGKDGNDYQGVVFGAPSTVYVDANALLLTPAEAETALPTTTTGGGDGGGGGSGGNEGGSGGGGGGGADDDTDGDDQTPKPPVSGPTFRRFHGTVDISPANPLGEFTEIVDSVIQHFTTKYGTGVSLSIDIEAKRDDGFDPKTVRTVKENAKVLKFNTAEFEEE